MASPSTRLADVNDKVEFYGGIASVRHYLVIEQDRRRVVCHGRGPSGGLARSDSFGRETRAAATRGEIARVAVREVGRGSVASNGAAHGQRTGWLV